MPDTSPDTAVAQFAPRLVAWQKSHGRHDLPWQQTRDAFRIWLSEIMLQQTQVATVIPYYARFLDEFPTLSDLAAAPLERVLELWAGLGYYARARNLHACAVAVQRQYGGEFPRQAARIAELPGIGRSTAAAIAAFAYGERGAILDGNVKRVLTRCFGVAGFPGSPKVEKALWQLAESLLPHGPGEIESYTQGIMDLGASLCSRSKPACAICPMHDLCVARREGRQAELPEGKPVKKAVPERHVTALILHDGARILVERRPPTGIWGGLLALPEVPEGDSPAALVSRLGLALESVEALPEVRHAFTHFRLFLTPLLCRVSSRPEVGEGGLEWLPAEDFARAALPAPLRKLLLKMPSPPWGKTGVS
ncbi:A/G-specific adenine glycosylase [Azospira sp. I13]|uniref:A/G-specific adenine glycosylase n=1 Tax=Azospira sp. I13 TaxID=1765050 RepID=UPI000D4A5EE5|nr:A/G-specific adenine glycosylase [Azospira sp. I13]GBG03319.1 A/G-specific adenine glycosylase [Azospira sp. I13]